MIIYPPFIADTIPAFTTDKIVIPFQQNPVVGIEEVNSFSLIVKDYLSSNILLNLTAAADTEHLRYDSNTRMGEVVFNIADNKTKLIEEINNNTGLIEAQKAELIADITKFPETKQYYKFQMSYSDGTINPNTQQLYSAYSTASIGRCIGVAPSISINGMGDELNSEQININTTYYTGKYVTTITSEPIYSYHFKVVDEFGTVIQDTGELLHNVDYDTVKNNIRTSIHYFRLKYELDPNIRYIIQYGITTVNGYSQNSNPYQIIKAGELPNIFQGELLATQDSYAKDNGYVLLSLYNEKPMRGTFIIERTQDNREWTELTSFSITNISDMNNFTWKDWSVEQGVKYTYALRQKANNKYSERILSKPIQIEFEDMFLSDGKRQLKIQYNPKVSSFKNTILEQKTDTIGSQYPFFFRNNMVKYKEIPISGLISYHMDEAQLFMTNKELGFVDVNVARQYTNEISEALDDLSLRTTQLSNQNFVAERKFKLEVLDWLTNGELKLFRSPAEGNYVVRLMNTSLSPNDTIGRLLHTFSATAYEAAENTIDNLINLKLFNLPELSDPEVQKVLVTLDLNWYENAVKDENQNAVFISQEIEKLQWYSNLPNRDMAITIDNEQFYNTTGLFTTPKDITFSKLIIPKEVLIDGNITFWHKPIITEEMKGEDQFATMINASENILFSVPRGYQLWSTELHPITQQPIGILKDNENTTLIYKTYILKVQRDMNAEDNEDFNFIFTDENGNQNIIDCSDGQVRTYYNLDPSLIYEKGKGLHVDIYARIQTKNASSQLEAFVLNGTELG